MEDVVCCYCGEEAKYKPLVPKPSFFIYENMMHQLVYIQKENELICLECLDYETNELKDVY
jgi:hypothetical protein